MLSSKIFGWIKQALIVVAFVNFILLLLLDGHPLQYGFWFFGCVLLWLGIEGWYKPS